MRSHRLIGLAIGVLLAQTGFARETEQAADWKPARADFSVGQVAPRQGWIAESHIAPDRWEAVEQADLAAEMEAAPRLELADVAPPPQRCWVGHRPYLAPNPDGRSWDMVFPYYNTYGGRQEVVIHDFGTGQTRKQVLSTRQGDSESSRTRIP
jgi:hypothetical protein